MKIIELDQFEVLIFHGFYYIVESHIKRIMWNWNRFKKKKVWYILNCHFKVIIIIISHLDQDWKERIWLSCYCSCNRKKSKKALSMIIITWKKLLMMESQVSLLVRFIRKQQKRSWSNSRHRILSMYTILFWRRCHRSSWWVW
jgi:hypothetical protein